MVDRVVPIFLPPRILLMRAELYRMGEHTPERGAYIKEHQLNLDLIEAHAGLFTVVLAQMTCHTNGVQYGTSIPTASRLP